MSGEVVQIPVFPLGSVHFPHTPLALRIFERRYLVMLGMLLEETPAEFGVVLIERGSETGGGEQRFGLGTMARLERVLPQEGVISVLARGGPRFEVLEWLEDDPYPRARVRMLAELPWNDVLDPLLEQAEAIVRRVLARAGAYGPTSWQPDVELAEDRLARAWQVAAIAPVGPLDQLELLRATSLGALLSRTIDLTVAAEEILASRGPLDDEP
jgi:Lon protease-like protein